VRIPRWLIVAVAVAGLLAAAVGVWPGAGQSLSQYQRLKTQYFTAVCDIEPFWFSKAFSDTPVETSLKDEIQEMAGDLREQGVSPKRAVPLLSFLVQVLPEEVLWRGSSGALDEARVEGLVGSRYRPAISPRRAARMAEATHRLHQAMGDELDGYGITYNDQRELCSPTVNGKVVGNGAPAP
jgi:hypothetical protein